MDAIYVSCGSHWTSPSLLESNGLCLSRLSRRPALFPPRGEEKEKREAREPERHSAPNLSVGSRNRQVPTYELARARRHGYGRRRDRERFLRDQRRPADDGERLPHE